MRTLITHNIRVLASYTIAADPIVDDPMDLYRQIRPILNKLHIGSLLQSAETKLIPGQVQGKNSLYQLFFRRTSEITTDIIANLNRNRAFVNLLMWDQKGIIINLWYPYIPSPKNQPAEPQQPGVPTQPGVPPAVAPTAPI